jgi:hypothetical protein
MVSPMSHLVWQPLWLSCPSGTKPATRGKKRQSPLLALAAPEAAAKVGAVGEDRENQEFPVFAWFSDEQASGRIAFLYATVASKVGWGSLSTRRRCPVTLAGHSWPL